MLSRYLRSGLVMILISFGMIMVFNTTVSAQAEKPRITKSLRNIAIRPFRSVCNLPSNHFASCHAKVSTLADGVTPLAGATPPATAMTPQALHIGYQLPCSPGGIVSGTCPQPAGFGSIIAIVDAYHAPNIENDLNVYSNYFGIPQCTKANGCLQVVNQTGGSSLPTTVNSGWALETSMDVEVAHAICQTCKILLVEATSATYSDLGTAVNTAAAMGAVAISNSYGSAEFNGEKSYDTFYNHPGVAVTVSSGDSGYGSSYPAASPNVIAVGGTSLQLFTDLTYSQETVWSGAGSGCSIYESALSYQIGLSNWSTTFCGTGRAIADVSAVADPNTGAAVYDSTPYSGQSGWWQVGGTSLSSPLVAATFGLVGGSSNPAQTIYSNASGFHDVVSGSNGSCTGIMCLAGTGYDGPTGLGTPNGLSGFGGSIGSPTPTATPTPTLPITPTATPTPTPTMVPDTTPPVVTIKSPTNGSRVSRGNTYTIRATANDNVKVLKVEFYVNSILLSTDASSPYTASWRVPNTRNVTYTISAKAYDTSGNTSSSSITVTSR